MATITKPPILDETGQDIVTKLNNINTQVTALNALIADLGLVSITPISQADYDDLSPTDKLNGVFDIYDAVEPNIASEKVTYGNGTVKNALDNRTRFIKIQNPVASITTDTGSYTLVNDCIMTGKIKSNSGTVAYVQCNGQQIAGTVNGEILVSVPLRKGSVVTVRQGSSYEYTLNFFEME